MSDDRIRVAVAASALAGEQVHADLLRSVADVARGIFGARAASIMMYDEQGDELVFQAVSGYGADSLVGARFPSTEGVAGWVLRAREPLVIDDVTQDPRFARELAEDTGYVPKKIMAAPLLRGERGLGVLSVLDPPAERPVGIAEMDLLGLFARQAALALDVVERARGAGSALEGEGEIAVVGRVAEALEGLEGPRREAGLRLLAALEAVLDPGHG